MSSCAAHHERICQSSHWNDHVISHMIYGSHLMSSSVRLPEAPRLRWRPCVCVPSLDIRWSCTRNRPRERASSRRLRMREEETDPHQRDSDWNTHTHIRFTHEGSRNTPPNNKLHQKCASTDTGVDKALNSCYTHYFLIIYIVLQYLLIFSSDQLELLYCRIWICLIFD